MLHWLTASKGHLTAAHKTAKEGEMQSGDPKAAPSEPAQGSPLHAEQLRLLFRFSLVGYLATLLVVFILGAILWEDLARPALFAWFVAVGLVALGRYLMYKAYIEAAPEPEATLTWERRFIAGTVLAGLCWTVIGTLLLPDATRMVQRLSRSEE